MEITTGKGKISLMMLIALWSLSLGVNLPGLAVTPVLDYINQRFPDVTPFKVTLLEALPNFVIIPFMLLAGKLSLGRHKIAVIACALVTYVAAAVLYMFCESIDALIWVSGLLGAGSGLLIPFSTGLIADVFTGKYQVRQMGIASAISNIALIIATFIVGVLATVHWNFPFLVYTVPLVSLLLLPWLTRLPSADLAAANCDVSQTDADVNRPMPGEKSSHGFYVDRLVQLLGSYFLFVFVVNTPTIYISFLEPGISTTGLGILTSCLYVGMSVVGIFLGRVIDIFKSRTVPVAFSLVVLGASIFLWNRSDVMLGVAFMLMGLGNGVSQPVFYSKATRTCVDQSHSTLALSFLLTANYLAVALGSSIIDALRHVFHTQSELFPFVVVFATAVATMIYIIIKRNSFSYKIDINKD